MIEPTHPFERGEGYTLRASCTILTVRSLTSGEYLFVLPIVAPFSKVMKLVNSGAIQMEVIQQYWMVIARGIFQRRNTESLARGHHCM